jgi:hypothetical protein
MRSLILTPLFVATVATVSFVARKPICGFQKTSLRYSSLSLPKFTSNPSLFLDALR